LFGAALRQPRILRRKPIIPASLLQGIAVLRTLASHHMEPDLAAMVLDSFGLTISDLEGVGAESLRPISRSPRPARISYERCAPRLDKFAGALSLAVGPELTNRYA
jgi:hypothetical protein